MSHFTVLVKLSANPDENEERELEEILAPYQENNMGDCPKEFLEFQDCTSEVEKTAKEQNVSLSEAAEFCGYKEHVIDEKTQYGYWENPNRKWDWWVLGGRWNGLLKKKDGSRCNAAQIKEINFFAETDAQIESFYKKLKRWAGLKTGAIEKASDERIEYLKNMFKNTHADTEASDFTDASIAALWEEHQAYQDDPWLEYEVRSILDSLGINPEETIITLEDLKTTYRWKWEFQTFAVLDKNGWHEKGKMGWFGFSSDTLEDRKNWVKSFYESFIQNEDPECWIAVVDCHI